MGSSLPVTNSAASLQYDSRYDFKAALSLKS